jgi:hypothetical protein
MFDFLFEGDSDSGFGPELNWLFAPDDLDPLPPRMPATGSQLSSIVAFDGTTDVEIWLSLLENAAVQFLWEDVDVSAAAKSKLKGNASIWLQAQRKAGLLFPDYQDVAAVVGGDHPHLARLGLRQALIGRFGERVSELAAADAVAQLTQRDGESVDTFYDRVVIALDRKNFSYTAVEKALPPYQLHFMADVYTFFGAGLLEYIRARTRGAHNPPRTAADLLVAARAVESEYLRNNGKKKIVAEIEVTDQTGDQPPDIKAPLELAVAALQKQFKELTAAQKVNLTCYRCQGKGHISTECPSPESTQPQNNSRGQRSNNFRGFNRGGRGGGFQRGGRPNNFRGRRGWNNNRGGNWQNRGGWNNGGGQGWRGQNQRYGQAAPVWAVDNNGQAPWYLQQQEN